jgi:predicted permease
MRHDLLYAVRMLRRSPGFTAAAVLCIALGIGANTAMFSLVEAALLRSLPVSQPERLAAVHSTDPMGNSINAFSYPAYVYLREHVHSIALLARTHVGAFHLSAGDITDVPSGELVSDSYFAVLGVAPKLGRVIVRGDENVVMLSHRFWKGRFHGDAAVVGRSVNLNGLAFTVIGVTPPAFLGVEIGQGPDLFVPLVVADRVLPGRARLAMNNSFWLDVMGRLQPGASIEQATAEIGVVYRQANDAQTRGLPPEHGLAKYLRGIRVSLAPAARGVGSIRGEYGTPLLILMAVVALVLLIACANVASLLLARASARQREIAVRLALGAGRARLVRQFVTESLVLSLAGGAAGLLFAWWSASALAGFLDRRYLDVAPNRSILLFTLAVSLGAGLLFGLAPAFQAGRSTVSAGLKNRRVEVRGLLVAGQVGISLLLLIGAGLFLRTLVNLENVDSGFHADHVVVASLNPGLSRYTDQRTRAFYDQLLERVENLPGVTVASVADQPLLAGAMFAGLKLPDETRQPVVAVKFVTPRYFETMGIALRAGRDFTPRDDARAPKVAIVNQTAVTRIFQDRNPLGRRVGLESDDLEIVGVIADTKYRSLRDAAPPTVYLPIDQRTEPAPARTLHVRTMLPPDRIAGAIRAQIRELDKELPVGPITSFASVVDSVLVRERMVATLAGFFGALAVLLVAIGLYGAIAYSVERRTREIGIRVALGAPHSAVAWMVMRQYCWMALAGLAAGLPPALWLARLVKSQLFGVPATDPLTMAGAMLLLSAAAALAAYLPARRAAHVDPMIALRWE